MIDPVGLFKLLGPFSPFVRFRIINGYSGHNCCKFYSYILTSGICFDISFLLEIQETGENLLLIDTGDIMTGTLAAHIE